ncbi:MAG: hypothetical protein JWQ66_2135 [Mucilaginibacter sp.]|nr:hypothetical protein [Mucilaginibacter sp.]
METLKSLNNQQKAKLIHNLFADEIPAFLEFLKEQATTVESNKQELKANWSGQMFGADFWIELAGDILKKTNAYSKDLKKSANVFSDQLFDGYLAVFTIHVLTFYADNEENINEKFKAAISLFFK